MSPAIDDSEPEPVPEVGDAFDREILRGERPDRDHADRDHADRDLTDRDLTDRDHADRDHADRDSLRSARRSSLIPPWLETPQATRWMLRGIGVLLLVALGSCFAVGADRARDPHVLPAAATSGLGGHSRPSRVRGFAQISFRVVDGAGRIQPVRCALLADKPTNRQQGMKGRRNLGGYDAMLFRWLTDSQEAFVNQGVPIPLSLAWFDADGVLVGMVDMPVCTTNCPTFAPDLPYRMAIEVPRGGLSHLGIGTGSVLSVGSAC